MAIATWGQTVRVSDVAPVALRPGSTADVVGIREVETLGQVEQFGDAVGTKVYLIEFGDGESVEVPERWIETVAT